MALSNVSRRSFITRTSVAVAATSVSAAVATNAVTAGTGIAGASGASGADDAPDLSVLGDRTGQDLVVHVSDAAAGEISLFSGTEQVVVRDRALAGRLVRAARTRTV
jgi:hypothetical protein